MGNKCVKIIRKYYEYCATKIRVRKEQKYFRHQGVTVKYLYKPQEQSQVLVVVFSACTRQGISARYNYVKTLEGSRCHRLYILDDFGPDGRGSFYLGRMPEFREQEATIALVSKYIRELNPSEVLFCGSSKGGYAALNIGSRFPNARMIIGEPTYLVATEQRLAEELEKYWLGEITEEKIEELDSYLREQLRKNPNIANQKIAMFYSDRDEYYRRHILPLLEDLSRYGYQVEQEIFHFCSHSDLALYFPEFLIKKVSEVSQWKK